VPRPATTDSRATWKRYLPFVIIATVALMAAGGGAMLLRSKQRPATTATAAQVSGGKPGAQPPHVRGQADALAAAYAAEAAGLQGRFWEMHDLLYQEQRTWHYATKVEPLFTGYAQRLGLDVERFQRDSVSEEAKARVAADRERAAALRVTETPTLFINERALPSTHLQPDRLRGAIEATLNGKPAF
jgi:predicted DsbA family dithiol-disulfide isomerase